MTKNADKHERILRDGPLTIVFVRHAQAGRDAGGGELGPPLSRLGERQAQRVARRLSAESFDHIYSSDLARAWQTTQAILKCQDHPACTVTSDLREVLHHHFAPGRRSLTLVTRRKSREERAALERFVGFVRRTHGAGDRILVVCHGNVIRTIVPLFARHQPEKMVMMETHNASMAILEVWPSGEAVLKLANCVKHLAATQVTGFLRSA